MHSGNTSILVDFWWDSGSRSDDLEPCTVEQGVRSSSNRLQTQDVAMSGKTFAEPETLQSMQRDGEMHSVWSDAELLAEGRTHGETPRYGALSVHAGRGHPPTSRVQGGTDEDGF